MYQASHAAGWVVLGLVGALAAWGALPPSGRAQFPPPPPTSEGEGLPPEPPAGAAVPAYGGPADPPTPAVAVRVRVPATAAPGKELEYRISVENRSAAAANHVEVRSAIPDHAGYVKATPEPTAAPAKDSPKLAWKLGTLGPGARREITLVVKPDGTGDVDACARVVFEHGQCVRTRVARPDVRVRRAGPSEAALNDLVTYRLEVTNAGAAESADVVLTDLLPEGLSYSTSNPSTSGKNPLTWKLGKLAPGQTRRIEYQVIAEKRGTFEDKAAVAVDGKVVGESAGKVVVGEPDLEVIVTGPKQRTLDRPATYRITVSNPGTLPAANVRVADLLYHEDGTRERVEFLGASPGGGLAGRDVQWALGTLPPGGRRTVEVTLRARREGTFTNVVRASADRNLAARGAADTEFTSAAGLTLDIDKDRDPLPVGGEAVLTLRLRNRTAAAAMVTELRVTLPDQLKVVRVGGPGSEGPDGQTVTFAPPPVAAGAEAVFTVTVRGKRPGAGPVRTELSTEALAGGAPAAPAETVTVVPDGPAKKGAKEGDKP